MYFLEAGLLARAVRRRRIRLLHNHFGDSSCTVAMLAAQLGGFSFSFTLHGPGIFFEPYTWRLDAKLDRAAFCACISYFCRSQAAIFAPPEHLDRLHIVHCGVYPDALPLVTHRPGAEDSTSTTDPGTAGSAGTGGRLLFVARLTELKGVSVLLEALAAVIKAHPGTQLTIIGDGPGRDRFEQLTRDLGLDQAVTFAGYLSQTEVTEHLAGTDVFVLPSYAEGVPVTLMEALGSGVPVVATQVGGVSELVKHGHNGFIVRPGDPDELAERVCQLLAEPELRQQFGAAGRALVAEEFATPTEAARLHTLFANTVAGLPTPLRPDPAPAVQDAASRP
jgi:glycosyltransferase involved in cell wall biosynthesis